MATFLRKPKKQPVKLLVARTDRIGDFILTLPVIETLSRAGYQFTILCQKMVRPLLQNNPFVDQIITVEKNDADTLSKIKSEGFDALLVLVNDRTIRTLLPHLKDIPVRVGPLNKLSALLNYTHPVVQKRSRSLKNEADYNLELLEVFDLKPDRPVYPRIYFSDQEISDTNSLLNEVLGVSRLPEKLVIVHQGTGGSALNWPETYYVRLVEGLLKTGHHVILTGNGENEEALNRNLVAQIPPDLKSALFDLSNKDSLRQFAAMTFISRGYIGPNTGTTHVAAAAGANVFCVYPPIKVQSPARWAPLGKHVTILLPDVQCGEKFKCSGSSCPDYYCMEKITPDDVIRRLMDSPVLSK